MKTRRCAKKTHEVDKKHPPKKIRKKSIAAKKKRRTSSNAIISNLTNITTKVAVGTSNISLRNVSERPSEMQPKCAEPKYVQHVQNVEAKGYCPDGQSYVAEEFKWPCVVGKDPLTDDD